MQQVRSAQRHRYHLVVEKVPWRLVELGDQLLHISMVSVHILPRLSNADEAKSIQLTVIECNSSPMEETVWLVKVTILKTKQVLRSYRERENNTHPTDGPNI